MFLSSLEKKKKWETCIRVCSTRLYHRSACELLNILVAYFGVLLSQDRLFHYIHIHFMIIIRLQPNLQLSFKW